MHIQRKMTKMRRPTLLSWVARVWSIASIAFVLLFVFGEGLQGMGKGDLIGFVFWPIGVLLGLIIAWRHEGLGGSLAIGSLTAFYAWNWLERSSFPGGPYFLLVAAPAILFVASWVLSPWPPERRTAS